MGKRKRRGVCGFRFFVRAFRRGDIFRRGLTRRLRRGSGTCRPIGVIFRGRTEGVQGASGKPPASGMIRQLCRNQFPVGGRVGFDIPWVSRQLRCPKVSKGRAESPLVRPQAHPPCRGIDAPTPAREWDLPSHGALTLFFRWRKKSVQKKASGTATPGKSPLMPILTAGLATSRAI